MFYKVEVRLSKLLSFLYKENMNPSNISYTYNSSFRRLQSTLTAWSNKALWQITPRYEQKTSMAPQRNN